MSDAEPLHQQLVTDWPTEGWCDVGVVLSVSGGADSMALLRAMKAIRPQGRGALTVAHFNHRWRGAESDADQRLVEQVCESLQLACHVGQASDDHLGAGSEDAARQVRYEFLQRTAREVGARYVATAHTADDQAETILHRLIRGTGIAGLSGIPRVRDLGEDLTLIRPMLQIRRHQVLDYLRRLTHPYREDKSNEDVAYTRNRVRRELLPLLASDYNPAVDEALTRLGKIAGEYQQLITSLVAQRFSPLMVQSKDRIELDCGPLSDEPRLLVRELFAQLWRDRGWPQQSMGYDQWSQLAELAIGPQSATITLPGAISAQKRADRLLIKQGAR